MKETNVITIEKNIPIPKPVQSHWGVMAKNLGFVKTMDVGDSFVINGNTPNIKPVSVRSYIYGLNYEHRKNEKEMSLIEEFADTPQNGSLPLFTIRTLKGTSENPKCIRVWRTK